MNNNVPTLPDQRAVTIHSKTTRLPAAVRVFVRRHRGLLIRCQPELFRTSLYKLARGSMLQRRLRIRGRYGVFRHQRCVSICATKPWTVHRTLVLDRLDLDDS